MNWKVLENENQIKIICEESKIKPQIIFKHSTSCYISNFIYKELKLDNNNLEYNMYYLDLLKYRNISKLIEFTFKIEHQSPQILIIKNNICIYSESHQNINIENIYLNLK